MIRILCLHGWNSNSNRLRNSMKKLIELTEGSIEFVFVDSPIVCACTSSTTNTEEDEEKENNILRQWWTMSFNHFDTAEESMNYVADIWNNSKPSFHGILGFSQGSVLVQLLLLHEKLDNTRFAILCSTFEVKDPRYAKMKMRTSESVAPILCLGGRKDELTPFKEAKAGLQKFFASSDTDMMEDDDERIQCFDYKGGHNFPSQSKIIDMISNFIFYYAVAEIDQ